MLDCNNDLRGEIKSLEDESQQAQKLLVRAKSEAADGYRVAIEANQRNVSLIKARIEANTTKYSDLITKLTDYLIQTTEELRQPLASLLQPDPVPL